MSSEGSPIDFEARDPHYDEGRERECPGVHHVHAGELDAPCDTCGGRSGWVMLAVIERARLCAALDQAEPAWVEFAEKRHRA